MDVDLEPQVLAEAPHEIRHQYLSAAKARRTARLAAALQSWSKVCNFRSIGTNTSWSTAPCTTFSLSADLAAKSA